MFLAKNNRNFKYCRCLAMIAMIFLATATSANTFPPTLTNESSANSEIRMYATNMGISIQEAKRRFNLIDKARYLEDLLSRKETATFAGLWLEHKPKFQIAIQFSGKTKKNISAYMRYKDVAAIVDVRHATLSLVALNKIRTKVQASITKAGINFSSDINVQKNRVELYITKHDSLNKMNIINKVRAQFPKTVLLISIQ